METTRRGFIGRALAGLAALTVPAGVAKGASAPVFVAARRWVTKDDLLDDFSPRSDLKDAIYTIDPTDTPFIVSNTTTAISGTIRITGLNQHGEVMAESINNTSTTYPDGSPRYEWSAKRRKLEDVPG